MGAVLRCLPIAATALLVTLVVVACENPVTVCAGVGYNAVRVAITDQSGNPMALGALVKLYDGSYSEQDSTLYDPLNVEGAEERGGRTYDVQVSERYYNDAWVRGVRAPGGGCVTGHEATPVSIRVPVTLSLAAGAPAIRAVHVLPPIITLDRGRAPVAFTAYVDANADVTHAVQWSIKGDTASVGFDAATGTLTYRCRATSGYLTLTARSVADSSQADSARVAVQGHPASTTDPPCS
jgi:hypothetical protein